jgi:hypothetical protein
MLHVFYTFYVSLQLSCMYKGSEERIQCHSSLNSQFPTWLCPFQGKFGMLWCVLGSTDSGFHKRLLHYVEFCFTDKKQTPWPLVRKRTKPTERLPLIDEI